MQIKLFWWVFAAAVLLVVIFATLLYSSGFGQPETPTQSNNTFLLDANQDRNQRANQTNILELDTSY